MTNLDLLFVLADIAGLMASIAEPTITLIRRLSITEGNFYFNDWRGFYRMARAHGTE
ncbi:hypothetical protein [uncultured Croceicoccus sp.]|uniref:hypothetical protein n=1 Tax=uncultured Croceicoccus sp. TaxID=1295329 RepID=UPI002617DCFD|nr:hypothetical protein [uncultured Croceicoccus sp.]